MKFPKLVLPQVDVPNMISITLRKRAWSLYQEGFELGLTQGECPDFEGFKRNYFSRIKRKIAFTISAGQSEKLNEAYFVLFQEAFELGKSGQPCISEDDFKVRWEKA